MFQREKTPMAIVVLLQPVYEYPKKLTMPKTFHQYSSAGGWRNGLQRIRCEDDFDSPTAHAVCRWRSQDQVPAQVPASPAPG